MKKLNGEIHQYIVILIGLFVIMVMLMASLSYIDMSVKYIRANQLSRNYLLRIESDGYLVADRAISLRRELEEIGLVNIDLSGTTMSPAENGDDIFLCIRFSLPYKKISLTGHSAGFVNSLHNIQIRKSSTCKS